MAWKDKSEVRNWIEMVAVLIVMGIAFGIGIGLAATIAQVVPRWLLGGAP